MWLLASRTVPGKMVEAKGRLMGPRISWLIALVTIAATSVFFISASRAGASGHPNYRLGDAKSCRAHYVKKAKSGLVSKRTYVDGKWEVKSVRGRYIECVYVVPVTTTTSPPVMTTTTTLAPVTTTTKTQIYDQPVTLEYDSFLSYNETLGGEVYGSEHRWAGTFARCRNREFLRRN
jgi:hypothetical protein